MSGWGLVLCMCVASLAAVTQLLIPAGLARLPPNPITQPPASSEAATSPSRPTTTTLPYAAFPQEMLVVQHPTSTLLPPTSTLLPPTGSSPAVGASSGKADGGKRGNLATLAGSPGAAPGSPGEARAAAAAAVALGATAPQVCKGCMPWG